MSKRRERTDNFNKAGVGAAALEACGACGQETGTVLLKARGSVNAPDYDGPRLVVNPEARCEFCCFLGLWMADQKIEPGKVKVGASKIVERLADGTDKLLAFVPFTENEPRDKQLFDGTAFVFNHGMVLRAECDEQGFKLVEILKAGV